MLSLCLMLGVVGCGDDDAAGDPSVDGAKCARDADCGNGESCQQGACVEDAENNATNNNPNNDIENNDGVCTPSDEGCDGIDNDCDELIDEGCDDDGDRYCETSMRFALDAEGNAPLVCVLGPGDCNDNNANVHPGVDDVCDLVDNDCDDEIDEDQPPTMAWPDNDNDNFGDRSANPIEVCAVVTGFSEDHTDCDDTDASNFPGAEERCDERDNDCDDTIDEEATEATPFYRDSDEDLAGDDGDVMMACSAPEGYVADNTDCDDTTAARSPLLGEICGDGIDSDCDEVDPVCNISGVEDVSGLTGIVVLADENRTQSRSLAIGNVFGDTTPDLIIGNPHHNNNRGVVRIFPGPLSGVSGEFLSPINLMGILGSETGSSVAVGNLVGDEVLELVVGIPGGDTGGRIGWGSVTAEGEFSITQLEGRVLSATDPGFGLFVSTGHFQEGAYDGIQVNGSLGSYSLLDLERGTSTIPDDAQFIYTYEPEVTLPTQVTPGDATGNGLDDVLVGWGGEANFAARVAIFQSPALGMFSGMDGAAATITPIAPEGAYGNQVIVADVDGDNAEEVIVSNYGYGDNGQGRVWIYPGPVLGELDHDLAYTITGPPETLLGFTMTVGDFNADGVGDLALGCAYFDADTDGNSLVHVVYGPIDRDIDLAVEPDALITGTVGIRSASAMASGDVSGDGIDDLVIYAGNAIASNVWVVLGGPRDE